MGLSLTGVSRKDTRECRMLKHTQSTNCRSEERLRLEDLAIDDGAAEGKFVGVLQVVAEAEAAGQ